VVQQATSDAPSVSEQHKFSDGTSSGISVPVDANDGINSSASVPVDTLQR